MIFWIVLSLIMVVILILAGLIGIVAVAWMLPYDWAGMEEPNEHGRRPL